VPVEQSQSGVDALLVEVCPVLAALVKVLGGAAEHKYQRH
jgi:hypothetical protein